VHNARGCLVRLKKIIPEILVLGMIAWQSTLFPDYLPTNNDDLAIATQGVPWGAWWGWWEQNRATALISVHFHEFFTKASFDARHLYGLHVASFYAPLAVIYIYLVSVSKRYAGLLAFAVAISYQVIGYDYTTPLAYPFTFSLGLSGIAATSLFGGKDLKRKENPLRCVGYVLAGTIFASTYEPFALIFCTLFLLAYLVEFKPSKTNRSHLTLRAVLLGATPLILIVCAKISLIGINAFYPDLMGPSTIFNTYSGSKLRLSSPLLSLRVAANHFIGATIFGHITAPLTWPQLSDRKSVG
jgi:hypothetical protein